MQLGFPELLPEEELVVVGITIVGVGTGTTVGRGAKVGKGVDIVSGALFEGGEYVEVPRTPLGVEGEGNTTAGRGLSEGAA